MRHQNREQFRFLFQVKVSNPRNGSLIGYVGNVSESGLKILSYSPFVQEERLRLCMTVPEGESMQFDLDATCKWSGNNSNLGYFEGGFCLDQPSATFASMVEGLRNRRSKVEKNEAEEADFLPVSLSA
jgi:hypothetical protein